jgi:hypothetical protein
VLECVRLHTGNASVRRVDERQVPFRGQTTVLSNGLLSSLVAPRIRAYTGGSIAAGVALGSGILTPRRVEAAAPDDPLPIPGGSPTLGGAFHVYGPSPTGFLDPIDAEPASITNFNGVVGMAYIDGMVTQTRISNGEQARYPFVASDMRFMQGVYRGADGKPRQGTFGFI